MFNEFNKEIFKRYFIIISLIVFFGKTNAQNHYAKFIEDKLYTGFVVNNFLNFDSFPKVSPVLINEFKIGRKTLGAKNWHQFYNYPEVGVSLLTGSLGNNRQFGKTVGIVPNISFNLKDYDDASLKMTFGWGLSYFNKPYNSITNPYNILIGSHLTHTAIISLYYQKCLSKNFYIDFSGTYIHSSNGHYQVPNGGMNLGTISVGLKKYFSEINIQIQQDKPQKRTNIDFYINLGYGIHVFAATLAPIETPKFKVYTTSFLIGKNYNFYGKYFIGGSIKYYESFNYYINEYQFYNKNLILKSSIITFLLGNEFQFGNFSIFIHGGLNLYTPFIKNYVYKNSLKYNINNILELLISTKLGMRYYFFNPHTSKYNVYTSWAIKANFGNADFTEISLGFVF